MSFDENQQLYKDEIDLVVLFKSIWFYKFSLIVFIIISVPASVMFSTTLKPKYKAETVFEKPVAESSQKNSSLLGNSESSGLISVITGSNIGPSDSFYSEIRSESFLKTVILNNANLRGKLLQRFCPLPSKEISRFSLLSLLISLGISENRTASESQKISLLVKCVNGMLEIGKDSNGDEVSSAYRLSITSGDPIFSATLANEIVEKYFVRHEKVQDQEFQNVKKYLSKVITEAQREFTEANKLIQNFKIKHTLLMNINSSPAQNTGSTAFGDPESPFVPELNKEIANLSQLEKSLNQLKQARSNLSNFKELNLEKIKIFTSSTEVQGVLSRAFITAISKINNISAGISETNKEIKKIVSQELKSLKQQIQVLEEKIGKREEQTMKLMTIENRFQELAVDVSKKKLMFEGLKDQLKDKILTTGLANVERPVLLTKAVPPFSKVSPNKKLIVALGVVLSTLIGVAYIWVTQLSLKRVNSLSQLRNLSRFLSCYKIKYKQLKQIGERSGETVISQSFFSHTMGMGKLGCVIDISQKRHNNLIVSEFSKTVASVLATDTLKIVCLDNSPIKEPFSARSQKNSVSDHSNLNVKDMLSKSISICDDEDGMVGSGEIKKIKDKYSDYDKIICALGAEIGDLIKFKFIEKCDFYILIGRSFHFDEYTYKKFSNTVWEKEKKCLGFFLID